MAVGNGVGKVTGVAVGSGVGSAKGVGVGSGVGKAMAVAVGSGVGKVTGVAVGSGVGRAMGVGVGGGVGKAMGVAVGRAAGSGKPATAVAILAVVVASISSAEGPHAMTTASAASMMRILAGRDSIIHACVPGVGLRVRRHSQLHFRVQAKRLGGATIRINHALTSDPHPALRERLQRLQQQRPLSHDALLSDGLEERGFLALRRLQLRHGRRFGLRPETIKVPAADGESDVRHHRPAVQVLRCQVREGAGFLGPRLYELPDDLLPRADGSVGRRRMQVQCGPAPRHGRPEDQPITRRNVEVCCVPVEEGEGLVVVGLAHLGKAGRPRSRRKRCDESATTGMPWERTKSM